MTFPHLAKRSALFALTVAAVAVFFSGAAASQVKADPGVLHFGSVVVGTTETLAASVVNSGPAGVKVSSITSTSASYTVQYPALPVALSQGGSVAIKVAFKPGAIGSASGEIAINGGSASLKVSGSGESSKTVYATPGSIGFGSVPAGSSATSLVRITNARNLPVTIAKENLNGSSGFSVEGLSLPLTLTPGQTFTFKIGFSPTTSGSVWGSVVAANANGQGLAAILLTGTGSAAGNLSVSPSSLGFGSVPVGSNQTKDGTLTAAGSSVTVTSDATSSSEFTISGISLPATLSPGQSAPYKVTFTPQTSGAASGTLSFKTSNSGTTASESVSGTGVQNHAVDLSWNASTSGVSGYNIYRGKNSGGPYAKLNSGLDADTSYADSTVSASQTYYYVTTAVNSSGQESNYSNQVQVAIP